MRVVPVPDAVRDLEWVKGTRVYGAPDGDLTNPAIPPAEGILFDSRPSGTPEGTVWPTVAVIVELDDDDVGQIAAGARRLVMGWPGEAMPVFLVPFLLDE